MTGTPYVSLTKVSVKVGLKFFIILNFD